MIWSKIYNAMAQATTQNIPSAVLVQIETDPNRFSDPVQVGTDFRVHCWKVFFGAAYRPGNYADYGP